MTDAPTLNEFVFFKGLAANSVTLDVSNGFEDVLAIVLERPSQRDRLFEDASANSGLKSAFRHDIDVAT